MVITTDGLRHEEDENSFTTDATGAQHDASGNVVTFRAPDGVYVEQDTATGGNQQQAQSTSPNASSLDQEYNTAVQAGDWQTATEKLNAFNHEDIQSRLAQLSPDQVASLHQGALTNPRVGPESQVAQLTAPGMPPASTMPPSASTVPPVAAAAPADASASPSAATQVAPAPVTAPDGGAPPVLAGVALMAPLVDAEILANGIPAALTALPALPAAAGSGGFAAGSFAAGSFVQVGSVVAPSAAVAEGTAAVAGLGLVATGLLVVGAAIALVAIGYGVYYLIHTNIPVQPVEPADAGVEPLPGGVEADAADTTVPAQLPPSQNAPPVSDPTTPQPLYTPADQTYTPAADPNTPSVPASLPGAPQSEPMLASTHVPDWTVGQPIGPLITSQGTVYSGMFPDTGTGILYRKDPNTGQITHYQVYDSTGQPVKRVDITGASHGGVPTPHVVEYVINTNPTTGQEFRKPLRTVRPTRPEEVP